MRILGIETSCDDTSVALYDSVSGVAENLVSSQVDLHDHFGGVVPELASRAHLVNLLPLVDYLLERQQVALKDLDPDVLVHKLTMRVQDIYDPRKAWDVTPVIVTKNGVTAMNMASEVPDLRVKVEVEELLANGKMTVNLYEDEYVVMQAITFPMINILWVGCVLMALGSLLAVRSRVRQNRRSKRAA